MTTVIPICCLGAFTDHIPAQLNSVRFCFTSQLLRDGEGNYDSCLRSGSPGRRQKRIQFSGRWSLSGGHVERVGSAMRPLLDDEIIFTVESAARFLRKIGYQVIPPAA